MFLTPAINNPFPPQDAFDYSDDCSPGGTEGQKGSKVGDKSKDPVTGFKKIFSGPKKVRQSCQVLLCSRRTEVTIYVRFILGENILHFGFPKLILQTSNLWWQAGEAGRSLWRAPCVKAHRCCCVALQGGSFWSTKTPISLLLCNADTFSTFHNQALLQALFVICLPYAPCLPFPHPWHSVSVAWSHARGRVSFWLLSLCRSGDSKFSLFSQSVTVIAAHSVFPRCRSLLGVI